MNNKKRHHYVPTTYLNGFVDDEEKIWACRKDDPENLFHLKPDEIGLEKYYYSQPMQNGGRDNNTLEDFFSKNAENNWNKVISAINNHENLTDDILNHLMDFVVLQRIRVPAMRDAMEFIRAEQVKMTYSVLDKMEKFAPKPESMKYFTVNDLEVIIDPHQSLLAMETVANGFSTVLDMLGFWIIKNETDIPFITSDNPVIYGDLDPPDGELRPYTIKPDTKRVQFYFPLDSRHLLCGRNDFKSHYLQHGMLYKSQSDANKIVGMNHIISMFAYHVVFSSTPSLKEIVKIYAKNSPIAEAQRIETDRGAEPWCGWTFGERRKKLKW